MRVRDVMPSPAVTVPPDMRLKEVADLLALEVAPDPRAHLIPPAEPVDVPRIAAEVCPGSVEVRFLEE